MATTTIAGQEVELNDDGFMTDPDQWSREIAAEIARDAGIDPLTEKHWQVIEFCRTDAVEKGAPHHEKRGREPEGNLRAIPEGTGNSGREDLGTHQAEELHLTTAITRRGTGNPMADNGSGDGNGGGSAPRKVAIICSKAVWTWRIRA
jgi:hypothetical protein